LEGRLLSSQSEQFENNSDWLKKSHLNRLYIHILQLQTTTEEKMTRLLKGEKVDNRYHPQVLKKLLERYPESVSKQGQDIKRTLLTALPEARRQQVPYRDRGRPFNKKT